MADLNFQTSTPAGIDVTFDPADVAGDTIPVHSRGVLLVKNDDAASVTVTVTVPGTKYGQALADISKVVPAGGVAMFAPVPLDLNNGNGRADVAYSSVTNVSVAAVQT